MRWIMAAVLWALFFVVGPAPGMALDDQDRARSAVQSGQARPLGDILAEVRGRFPGRLLDADLQKRGKTWIYELRILSAEGQVTALTVDARSGAVLKAREGGAPNGSRGRGQGRGR